MTLRNCFLHFRFFDFGKVALPINTIISTIGSFGGELSIYLCAWRSSTRGVYEGKIDIQNILVGATQENEDLREKVKMITSKMSWKLKKVKYHF